MKTLIILFSLLISFNSYPHKLPPEVQLIVNESLSLTPDIKRGKTLYNTSCVACHGELGMPKNLNNSINPYLADQTPKYLLIHMAMFKTKHRTSSVMNTIANSLSSQDMADIKEFLVSDEARGVHCETFNRSDEFYNEADIEAGRILAQKKRDFTRSDGSVIGISCTMCHGDNGLMPEEFRQTTMHPDLAGQSAMYLYKEFLNFKNNTRLNAGPMNLMVRDLTEKDLKNLSAYYGSLSRCR